MILLCCQPYCKATLLPDNIAANVDDDVNNCQATLGLSILLRSHSNTGNDIGDLTDEVPKLAAAHVLLPQ
jgi:hypothetical protein